ncbi:GlxA family transcriptional regulator [Yoonia sp. 208BN28-4]|uniref:GlxA family transcriptional regulator n=1 Tax=Yoonia sp. 208BN28-4 TaxID=3126505 RepID=UPI00309EFC3B
MQDTPPIHFDVIVAEGFVLTEMAGVVDVLRLANRVAQREVFAWRYVSASGGEVASSSAASVQTAKLTDKSNARYAVALGNADPDHSELSLARAIGTYTARNARVILLSEAASRFIAEKGDQADHHTTHWENRAVLSERHGLYDTKTALAVDAGAIVTCAGMGATVDMMLSLAAGHVSSATMMTVADILLHERIRHHNTLQPFGGRAALTTGDRDLDLCVGLMQDHIEFPIPISEIADRAGLSKRSLERRFHAVLHSTPNGFYRELRLTKANNLLLNTDMSINEIGLACGFPSGFSTIYRSAFGMTPNTARKKGRLK